MSSYYVGDATKIKGYLKHYGVPGQSWGKRRYQNPDGSLTAEGRAHYGVGDPRGRGGFNWKRAAGIGLGAAAAAGAGYLAYRKLGGAKGIATAARRFGNKVSSIPYNAKLHGLSARRKFKKVGESVGLGARMFGKVAGQGAKAVGKVAGKSARALGRSIGNGAKAAGKAARSAYYKGASKFMFSPAGQVYYKNPKAWNTALGGLGAAGAAAGGVAYYKNRKKRRS